MNPWRKLINRYYRGLFCRAGIMRKRHIDRVISFAPNIEKNAHICVTTFLNPPCTFCGFEELSNEPG